MLFKIAIIDSEEVSPFNFVLTKTKIGSAISFDAAMEVIHDIARKKHGEVFDEVDSVRQVADVLIFCDDGTVIQYIIEKE